METFPSLLRGNHIIHNDNIMIMEDIDAPDDLIRKCGDQ